VVTAGMGKICGITAVVGSVFIVFLGNDVLGSTVSDECEVCIEYEFGY